MLMRTRKSAPSGAKASQAASALRRPRLLIVGPLPPPLGGVQLIIDMQLRSSLARVFELHPVDTSKRKLRWAVENPTWKTPLYFARDFLRLIRMLVRVRPDAALVHAASSLSILRDWMFMATARLFGAKVICYYHGTLHARFPSGETRIGRAVGRFLMSTAHRVIVLGPTYQREMGKAWRRDDLAWAPNMADVALFRNLPVDTPAPWLAPGERAVLFVGRLSAPKGIYDLFDAIPRVIERHPEARFVFVGVAERDALEREIRSEAARRGIAARVTFLGPLEGGDKAAAFVTSKMIVVPSRLSWSTAARSTSALTGSSPLKGSSRSTRLGCATTVAMNWTFWDIPLERASTLLSAHSASPIRSSQESMAGLLSRLPLSSA